VNDLFVETPFFFLGFLFELDLEPVRESQIIGDCFFCFHLPEILYLMKHHVNTTVIPDSLVARKYQIGIISSAMDNEVPKSVRLPQWIWDAIARDATEHYRSSNAQMTAILATYYGRPVPENIARRIEDVTSRGPNVETANNVEVRAVRSMGETTDERKQKPQKKRKQG